MQNEAECPMSHNGHFNSKKELRCAIYRKLVNPMPNLVFLTVYYIQHERLISLKYVHLDEGIFRRVRRHSFCSDSESYAGGSVATVRTILAGEVKGEHRDLERYTGPPGWGLGRWASRPSRGEKTHFLKTLMNYGVYMHRQMTGGVRKRSVL